jgi:hypothetical protein
VVEPIRQPSCRRRASTRAALPVHALTMRRQRVGGSTQGDVATPASEARLHGYRKVMPVCESMSTCTDQGARGREPKRGCELVVHAEQSARTIYGDDSPLLESAQGSETRLRVEGREHVDAAEGDVACSKPVHRRARGEHERIQAKRTNGLEQPSIRRLTVFATSLDASLELLMRNEAPRSARAGRRALRGRDRRPHRSRLLRRCRPPGHTRGRRRPSRGSRRRRR